MFKCLIITIQVFLICVCSFAQKRADVKEYTIDLNFTNIAENFIFGNTNIELAITEENTNTIILDFEGLTVDSIKCPEAEITEYSHKNNILKITLSTSFNKGKILNMKVYYHGNPKRDSAGWGGFFNQNDYIFNMGVSIKDIPHSLGRFWFPCNDTFSDRAKFKTIITTKESDFAACAGELVKTSDNPTNNTKTYEWYLDKEVPCYLISVAVGKYKLLTSSFQGEESTIPVDLYIFPNDSTNVINSYKNINKVLALFEDKFGPYPWNRVGYVTVNFNSGAMEHVTNIAMGRGYTDGSLKYEELFYHELSHMWFGNKVSCSSEEDMWLNEGWASYCETIFREFIRGRNSALEYRRENHEKVLRNLHFQDDGYKALSPMNQEHTYSGTIYQKGASVVHALRGYLGDDLFFSGIKAYLKHFAYQSVSSYDMRDFLSNHTNINLNDFFQDWVFSPGFTHYSIDSTRISPENNKFKVDVYIRQKLKGKDKFANSNRVEISFLNDKYDFETRHLEFDGEYGHNTFLIDFNPKMIICDYMERSSDARISYSHFLKEKETKDFSNTLFKANILEFAENDSMLLKVTQNWVAPDRFKNHIKGLGIANNRYWLVEGDFKDKFLISGEFKYDKTNSQRDTDFNFISNDLDSLVLIFRPNKTQDWKVLNATHVKTNRRFEVDTLRAGEYALAIYDYNKYSETDYILQQKIDKFYNIFPNPTNGTFTIKFTDEFIGNISIIDISGAIKENIEVKTHQDSILLNLENFCKGTYIIKFEDKNKIIYTDKIIKQ